MSRAVTAAAVILLLAPASSHANLGDAQFLAEWGIQSPALPGNFYYTVSNAVDHASGDVYVVENFRLQRFDANGGFITSWSCPCAGVAVHSTTHNVFVTLNKANEVREYTSTGTLVNSWGSPGTLAGEFDQPWGIDIDDATGDVYVMDTGNARVQVFDAGGSFVREIGSEFSGRAGGPGGLAFEESERVLWVADAPTDKVYKFDEFGAPLLVLDGSAGAGPHLFRWPRSVDVDAAGNVYVVETDAERIQVFDADGAFLETFQGPHSVARGPFHPRDITISLSTGAKYVNAAYAARVDKFDAANQFLFSFGGRLMDGEYLLQPRGLAVSPVTGDLFFFDSLNTLLKGVSPGGAWIHQWGGSRRVDVGQPGLWGSFTQSAVETDPDGNIWAGVGGLHYPDDPYAQFVQKFDGNGNHLLSFFNLANTEFTFGSSDLAVVPTTREVLVSDTRAKAVKKYSPEGVPLVFVTGFSQPAGIATTATHFYVIDYPVNEVHKYDLAGNLVTQWGAPGSGPGEFDFEAPSSLTTDAAGNVYVADSGGARIQRFDADGTFLDMLAPGQSVSTPGTFYAPVAVALSPDERILYVSDRLRHRILAFCLDEVLLCLAQMDHDNDAWMDGDDNCAFTANPLQEDGGGLISLLPDGIGDVCQCGDVDGDAFVGPTDLAAIREHLHGGATPAEIARCSVHGGPECDVLDAAVLARTLAAQEPGLTQACEPALR